jgi:hypothetical protein
MFKQEQHNNIGAPTYRHSLLQAILMAYDPSASLKDRFQYARQCLMEMFPRRRLGTRLVADDALELAPPCAVDCRCGIRRL